MSGATGGEAEGKQHGDRQRDRGGDERRAALTGVDGEFLEKQRDRVRSD